ncbi:MAG: M56 family metallopeptidase [Gemmatimonadaceae bacterium]|nr:M56 family metallopeptidase [Gloeobacterales cyanobacterium ES-bin-141]
MHITMLLLALLVSAGLRLIPRPQGPWQERWSSVLLLFLAPPLLVATTALSIVWMRPQGMWHWDDLLTCMLSLGFLALALVRGLLLAWKGWHYTRAVRAYPALDIAGEPGRLVETPHLFIAQVGFWQPELVVSRGLLTQLGEPHLEAVLAHEQAHRHYRDTFWFFWLGWVRHATIWLPNTEALWHELLAIRELRADNWAASRVDRLLLAEALVKTAGSINLCDATFCASITTSNGRLVERVEALLEQEPVSTTTPWSWAWLLLTLSPLAMVPFHSFTVHRFCPLM